MRLGLTLLKKWSVRIHLQSDYKYIMFLNSLYINLGKKQMILNVKLYNNTSAQAHLPWTV